ncbi:MAG: T9SS type A sorting domain-containing protein [Chitinophagaceae bacterium]|nr:T9SS type A sorting domain-containing protein [Chitinophagaceae bacterium]MCB9044622.1 T9SS type A sorting domain-containing protein [Chitinophagales bacterium]
MKLKLLLKKKICLLALMLFSVYTIQAQTTLSAGDIAFTGYNSDGADDSFSFILLAPISSGTVVKFTDQGWTGSALNGTEGEITWTSTSAMSALTVVTILPTGSGYASAGSLVINTAMSLATGGDQIFALQGTLGSPTFIAGVHMSVEQSSYPSSGTLNGTDSDWDGVAVGGSQSKLSGTGLTAGFSAVWLYDSLLTAPGGGTFWEVDNARAKCTALTGTVSQVRAKLFQRSYWDYDNGTAFAPTSPSCTPTSTTWNGSTWDNGAPTASLDAVIASSTTPGNFTCKDLTINSTYALTMGSGTTANINGSVTNNGNGFSGVGTFNFAASGSISGNTISTTGTITVASGATLTTNSKLTLSATSSTVFGTIGNSAGTISGNVTAECYIPGKRAFRFFGHPFTSSQALTALTDDIDITGSGGSTNGFTTTATNNPSAFWYDVTTATGSATADPGWTAFTSTNGSGANAWDQYEMIRVLVRGAMGEGLAGGTYTPSNTKFDMTGTVNQGSQVVNVTKGSGSIYAGVANPFPCGIQMNALTRGGGIASFYYVWDATSGAAGAYTVKLYSGSYILPPFAGYVTAIASTSTITFPESCKSAGGASIFKGTAAQSQVQLIISDSTTKWDELLISFDDNASSDYELLVDAVKFYNPGLDFFTLSSDSQRQALDVRPYADSSSIKLGLTAYNRYNKYVIRSGDFDIPAGTKLYLHDKYLNKKEEIKAGFEYWFDVTTDTLTQGNERFEINMVGKPTSIAAEKIITNAKMQLVPNPAQNDVKVSFANIEGTSYLRVVSITGQIVYAETIQQSNGSVIIPLNNVPAGVYVVMIQGEKERLTEKLIKE